MLTGNNGGRRQRGTSWIRTILDLLTTEYKRRPARSFNLSRNTLLLTSPHINSLANPSRLQAKWHPWMLQHTFPFAKKKLHRVFCSSSTPSAAALTHARWHDSILCDADTIKSIIIKCIIPTWFFFSFFGFELVWRSHRPEDRRLNVWTKASKPGVDKFSLANYPRLYPPLDQNGN